MQELREKSIKFMYDVFAGDCLNDDKLSFGSFYFNDVVNDKFTELTKDKKSSDKPFLLKLGGQSGAGKTTQLLPSLSEAIDGNFDYVHIAVRSFAKCHPYYDEFIEKYGDGLIREKTNGFALLCLFAVAEKLIKNKFNILFEVTLLDPDFEEYFIYLAKKYNYKIIYNILSVPLETSNLWIKTRLQNSKIEKNRIVSQNSIDFSYNTLSPALTRIVSLKDIFNDNDYIILWNIQDKEPILITNSFNNNLLNLFDKFREQKNIDNILDEKESLNCKKTFYSNFLKKVL